jgi:AmmeMemoRadiSam system protein B
MQANISPVSELAVTMKAFPTVAVFSVALLLLSIEPCRGIAGQGSSDKPFPALYSDPAIFSASIEDAESGAMVHRKVSGLTVPHHLVAADLIARAFRVAEKNRYDKIVILFPDHFKKARQPFATTRRSFETVFGTVKTDKADVAYLLVDGHIVEESDLFEREHGLGALLPYVKHFFPDTPIVPIAVSLKSTRDDLDRLIADLEPVITEQTLILQSTDFSHYLTHHEAIQRDQEVLNILAANDAEALMQLRQPAHLDSRGSQYLQMRLQAKHFHTRPLVIFNANSQECANYTLAETTSYVIQIYPVAGDEAVIDSPDPSGAKIYCFAGDTFFGRYVQKILSRPGAAEDLRKDLKTRLAGCPLIINLEGVMVEALPEELGPLTLAMPEDLSLDWLKALNVVAVSVANNHALDLGGGAFAKMVAVLEANGIKVLKPGEIADLGAFRIVALTDLDNATKPYDHRIDETVLRDIGRSDALPPLAAFLHWGTEYQAAPDLRQTALADALRRKGISLMVGAHPHQAFPELRALAGGQGLVAYSLGNFVFDQFNDRASSAILQVRFFSQGTFFARLVPIPNVYDVAHHRPWSMRAADQ